MGPSVLIVDDDPSVRRYMQMLLEVDSYQVETLGSGREAIDRVQRDPAPDVVLLDLVMPDLDGLEALTEIRRVRPQVKVVMVSCIGDPRKVVEAGRRGAGDYLTKPFEKSQLDAVLKSCFESKSKPAVGAVSEETLEELGEDVFFLASSPAMHKIREQAEQIARVDVPVLILGESGTGKEIIARLIHNLSPRAGRPFLKVNCAALPSELLESELFGYEPGAFTGANRPKPGKFEMCDKGTILLDEIGEMPVSMQAKLLHVLQDHQFSRLGSRSVVKADVRILAATNVDVREALATKKLRQDLYYRLNTLTLSLPPLRERREEIPMLLRHFMARFAARYARPPLAFTPTLVEACTKYPWPGNLRELENFVKRNLILGDEDLALQELAPREGAGAWIPEADPPPPDGQPENLKSMVRNLKDQAEAESIGRALERTNWNRKEAARLLGISYKALLNKVRQYGLDQR